jgi:hypothetical protein
MESPESWFHRRATFYVEAQILFHLNQVGVLGLLNGGDVYTAAEMAKSLHLDPGATDALLDYVYEVDELLNRSPQGKYSLSEFGRKVVDRFSAKNGFGEPQAINMFDVRVGAYGPVWQNLSGMLSGAGRYGEDFHRDGRFAETGVSKLAMNFWKTLTGQIEEHGVGNVLEIGLTTGLLDKLGEAYPGRMLYGLDRDKATIDRNAATAAQKQIRNIRWIQDDYFDPDSWCKSVNTAHKGLIYSLHFHELMAHGEAKFIEALVKLKAALPNWVIVAFEQPRLSHDERASVAEAHWLYAQSNILIHHLIGNGKILSNERWMSLGWQAGCREVTNQPVNYLGYQAYVFQL